MVHASFSCGIKWTTPRITEAGIMPMRLARNVHNASARNAPMPCQNPIQTL
jgi:hypothetical protein